MNILIENSFKNYAKNILLNNIDTIDNSLYIKIIEMSFNQRIYMQKMHNEQVMCYTVYKHKHIKYSCFQCFEIEYN